jgi:hypothetical protein
VAQAAKTSTMSTVTFLAKEASSKGTGKQQSPPASNVSSAQSLIVANLQIPVAVALQPQLSAAAPSTSVQANDPVSATGPSGNSDHSIAQPNSASQLPAQFSTFSSSIVSNVSAVASNAVVNLAVPSREVTAAATASLSTNSPTDSDSALATQALESQFATRLDRVFPQFAAKVPAQVSNAFAESSTPSLAFDQVWSSRQDKTPSQFAPQLPPEPAATSETQDAVAPNADRQDDNSQGNTSPQIAVQLLTQLAATSKAEDSVALNTDPENNNSQANPSSQFTAQLSAALPTAFSSFPQASSNAGLTNSATPHVGSASGTGTSPFVANVDFRAAGKPLFSVLQQASQLQGLTSDNHLPSASVIASTSQTDLHSQWSKVSLQPSLFSAPFFTSRAAATPTPASPKLSSSASDSQVIPSGPAVPSAQRGGSSFMDSSSNPDGQSTLGQSSTSATSASPDSAKVAPNAFSQSLAQESNVNASAAQITATPTSAGVATQFPTNALLSHTGTAAQPAPQAAPTTLPALNACETAASRFVSSAQLVEAAGRAEMHISMQTDKLGAIELHARVAGDTVGALIGVEKRDAHAALAVELPALQQALSEKQLRVSQVALLHGALNSTMGDSGARTPQGQTNSHQAPRASSYSGSEGAATVASLAAAEQTGIFTAQGRLSVRA